MKFLIPLGVGLVIVSSVVGVLFGLVVLLEWQETITGFTLLHFVGLFIVVGLLGASYAAGEFYLEYRNDKAVRKMTGGE